MLLLSTELSLLNIKIIGMSQMTDVKTPQTLSLE